MPRSLVLGPTQPVRLLVAIALLILLIVGMVPPATGAQDDPATPAPADSLVDVVLDPMPLAPSFVRLIRIAMEPGSSIPMRSHPGPKIDRIESGTLTVVVRDEDNIAAVSLDGADEAAVPAGEDVELSSEDIIVLPPETFYAFRNDGSEPVVLLSTIMLPAGHQRPPGITYADGEPASDAYDGVTNQILGDGVATALPTSPGRFVIDRVTVTADEPLAASDDMTLLSNSVNGVNITVDSGRVQVSRTVAPGPQRDSEPGAAYTLISGDGLFFPEGHAELTVSDGELVFTRITLTGGPPVESGATTGGSPEAAGTPAASGAGTVSILMVPADTGETTDSTPIPVSSRAPRTETTATAAEEPTATSTEEAVEPTTEATAGASDPLAEPTEPAGGSGTTFPIGSTVETVDVGVNVRAEPSTTAEVVLEVESAGTRFVVVGEPVSGDGFTWIPVQSVDDPSISGWVAADFLALV